jgi:hypothetical protein
MISAILNFLKNLFSSKNGGERTRRNRRKHLFRAGRRYGGKRTPGSKLDR